MTTYLVYTDDSGNQSISLHTGVLIPAEAWQACLDKWKKYRRALYRAHHVLTDFEIHAQEWIAGTGVPSADPVIDDQGRSINDTKGLRYEWARKALQTIAAMDGLQIHTDVVNTSNKRAAYRSYIKSLDRELAARGDFGIVVMDGDPKNPDPGTRQEHRNLPLRTRAIIEDGWVQDSSISQFIQIADLAAHSAFQHIVRNDERSFMWLWYSQHLHDKEWRCACQPS